MTASAANGAGQPRLCQSRVRERARALELGLEERRLRVEHFGIGDDAGDETLADHATRIRGGAHAVLAAIAARLDSSSR